MSARVLLEVGLRVLGFWLVFDGIRQGSSTLMTLSFLAGGPMPQSYAAHYLWASCGILAISIACGLVLIIWAPEFAARLYRSERETTAVSSAIGPGDVYHIATFLLGVYLLVDGAQMGVATLGRGARQGTITDQFLMVFVATFVHVVSGLILIFGARRIAEYVSSIAHDPESVPQQRLGLKVLLILMGLVAVALGAFRMLSILAP